MLTVSIPRFPDRLPLPTPPLTPPPCVTLPPLYLLLPLPTFKYPPSPHPPTPRQTDRLTDAHNELYIMIYMLFCNLLSHCKFGSLPPPKTTTTQAGTEWRHPIVRFMSIDVWFLRILYDGDAYTCRVDGLCLSVMPHSRTKSWWSLHLVNKVSVSVSVSDVQYIHILMYVSFLFFLFFLFLITSQSPYYDLRGWVGVKNHVSIYLSTSSFAASFF